MVTEKRILKNISEEELALPKSYTPKILMVDDLPENLYALDKLFRGMDVDLYRAESGNEALALTIHHEFALALLDIQMPEMDGYELAEILRSEDKTANLPFIFISAVHTDNLNVFKGYEKGAFSFITKPFQPEILINKVNFFIEKHQQEVMLSNLNEVLKHKNRELKSSNSELESFTYSVSHDLRSPLRNIIGYASLLKEDHGPDLKEEALDLLNVIMENSQKMSQLIDELLEFSKIGQKDIIRGQIDLKALTEEVLEEIGDNPKNLQVIMHDMCSAEGDQSMIRQVIFNLVSNAIKYSKKEKKPKIEIGAVSGNLEIIYTVKDNGVGFDMKYYDKLFGVFERLHRAKDFEGTGVGLALSERIINKHGGKIWAEAIPNKGAKFYFSLPVKNKRNTQS